MLYWIVRLTEDAEAIPDYDILIGGFPCQGFSMLKGAGRNPDDQRNTLYLQLVKQLNERQPKYFVFENVVGLTKGKMKPAFEQIKRELRGNLATDDCITRNLLCCDVVVQYVRRLDSDDVAGVQDNVIGGLDEGGVGVERPFLCKKLDTFHKKPLLPTK